MGIFAQDGTGKEIQLYFKKKLLQWFLAPPCCLKHFVERSHASKSLTSLEVFKTFDGTKNLKKAVYCV